MSDPAPGDSLFQRARQCLVSNDPGAKAGLAEALWKDWQAGRLQVSGIELHDVLEAGRPARPQLVHPRQLARRSLASAEGRAALIHALAHIEFNAINLACDAVFRFRDLPADYYTDWTRVAAEEARHFLLLRGRLQSLGRDYGDFPGHDGLWDMAGRTAADPLLRMAMVPRMLEARGLDVTPGMIRRLQQAGDGETGELLKQILHDEVAHVEAGSRWFAYLCRQRGLAPEETYFKLLDEFLNGAIRAPLNIEARRRAGFSASELARLQALSEGQ